ncbi:hypothetical protein WESB_2440 [Brachyspira pilosicoli WesB]|uniref:Uncharacterized protein n=2 Tax=Brachyspira pilosicoli TaxID=52584 RepID=K0JLD4_BRAPL|nr:hypothetical protein [Brachyspira pilosicoli]AFR69605.1 hypothetical protein B2904_orf248 [Brachyspira pilosicoli B2904]CCG57902.1 hypothetical protein WESB_2440 [Brachyspira pilosicoli WesB]SUW09126.1 Uncharacterised protein [Brachyspira pilosicoli]
MNIEFLLSAKFNRALPTKDRLFKSIVSSLNEVNINPLVMLSEYSILDEDNSSTLIYSFHPASDPVYFEYKEGTLYVTINSGILGAGYHRFIISVLGRIATRLDIVFEEDKTYKDYSGYFKEKDFDKLKNFFAAALNEYSESLLANEEFKDFMISMPYDYPMIEKEYYALSPLGYWGKSWFNNLVNAPLEDKYNFAREFFIWNDEEINADFWFKSLNSIIWLYFPFREIIDDKERDVYKKIIYCFQEAYKKDKTLPYPWKILSDIAYYLDDDNLAKFIESNKQNNIQMVNTDIGFRKEYARYSIAGGFNISLPMSFNIYRDDKTLVEFKNIHTYIAMQVYSFANDEIDAIMEYVIKQMDVTKEEKGDLTDIKIKDIKSAVYKKSMSNDDYVFTVVAVSKKLALLAWFTYNGKENEELCIEAIKSISIYN